MSNQSLILFDHQAAAILPTTLEQIDCIVGQLKDALLGSPISCDATGELILKEDQGLLSAAKTFRHEYETAAKAARDEYFAEFKRRKSITDTAILAFDDAYSRLMDEVAAAIAEKRKLEERINRQRQEEAARKEREERERQEAAERERQKKEREEAERLAAIERAKAAEANAARRAELEAQATAERERQRKANIEREAQRQAEELRMAAVARPAEVFEAPKTEGMREKVSFEFDIIDALEFMQWCIRHKPQWINKSRLCDCFSKREITETINAGSEDATAIEIPGLRVFRALGVTVKKAKRQPTLTVSTTKVEL